MYDKLDTEMLVVKGAEKRTNMELLALKEAQWNAGVNVRWVHSEAQLANSLTKSNGQREYEMFIRMGHRWRLIEDENMMTAKRRKENGLKPLEQGVIPESVKSISERSLQDNVPSMVGDHPTLISGKKKGGWGMQVKILGALLLCRTCGTSCTLEAAKRIKRPGGKGGNRLAPLVPSHRTPLHWVASDSHIGHLIYGGFYHFHTLLFGSLDP